MAHEKEPSSPVQSSPEPRGLLYILFSLFGFLVGRAFSSSYSLAQERIGAESDSHETGRQGQQPAQEMRIRAELTAPEHIEHQRTANDDRNYSLQKWLVWGTWLAFLAAGVYAGISLKIWREMQQQTCIQRNAAMNSERAWLGLDSGPRIDIVSLEHDKFQAVIQVMGRNFGKGPAFNAMIDSRIVTAEVDNNVQSSCNLMFPFVGLKPTWPGGSSDENMFKHEWGQVVFPGQPFGSIGNYSGGNVVNVLGKEAYVIGCIVYKDQFSEPHWTKFCYNTGDFAKDVVRDPSSFKHLYLCNTNNYTDETEKKHASCSGPVTAVPR